MQGTQFKLNEEIVTKFSPRIKTLSENQKDGVVKLEQISAECFEFIRTYIESHAEK